MARRRPAHPPDRPAGERALSVAGWRERFVAAGFRVDSDQLFDAPCPPAGSSRRPLPPLGARLAMRLHRLARGLDPEIRRERRRLRRIDLRLRQHGRRIEARLFVLRRLEGAC